MSKIENPCKINVFILALEKTHYFDLAINLKSWFQWKHPDYPRNIIDLAAREIERNEWQKAVSPLEEISDINLDQGTACHIYHLLGIGLFALGKVGEALHVWKKGTSLENGKDRGKSGTIA